MSTGFNDGNPNDRDFKHLSNPNNNFQSSRSMIPMQQVAEVQANLKCYNHRKGCKFFAKHHLCLCCMMLKSIGTEFFVCEAQLRQQDPDFAFSMVDWQREEYDRLYPYWIQWCDNYPRGATP